MSAISENNRQIVNDAYLFKEGYNKYMFEQDKVNYTSEYTFPNQKQDAGIIIDKFYNNPKLRLLSIIKRTKVGMDGLMVELGKQMATHCDDEFVMNSRNILFITGMSNLAWEVQLKKVMPECFVDNVFHHGKLTSEKLDNKLKTMMNGLIVIDEIDTGDKISHRLNKILKRHDLFNIRSMYERNIRFVIVSATMKQQLSELERWDNGIHDFYHMTIPDTYVSHKDLTEMGIIRNYRPIISVKDAAQWIETDIVKNYGDNYRVHIIRVLKKTESYVKEACRLFGDEVMFLEYSSTNIITTEEISSIFDYLDVRKRHVILIVKGFFRRANLIPNEYKLKIGAIMEYCGGTKKTLNNINAQIQGLVGRMTGYWKKELENGHKTGPFRTCEYSISLYERWYNDPFEYNKNYSIKKSLTLVRPEFVDGLTNIKGELTGPDIFNVDISEFNIGDNENVDKFWSRVKKDQNLKYQRNPFLESNLNEFGLVKCGLLHVNESYDKNKLYNELNRLRGSTGFDMTKVNLDNFEADMPIQKQVYVCYDLVDGDIARNPIILIRTLMKKE
jgi:hypothetical protein